MRQVQNLLVSIFILSVVACSVMPAVDTMNKRFALVEISYQEMITKATLYKKEKRLSARQIVEINKLFKKTDRTLALAYAALRANDRGGFDNKMQLISTALSGLRLILTEVEK